MFIDRPDNLNLYFLYSKRDEPLFRQLESHLATLRQSGAVDLWHDDLVEGGEETAALTDQFLEKADLVVLLISSDFLAGIFESERMQRLFERQKRREIRLVPVIARECLWEIDSNLALLRPVPRDGSSLASSPSLDRALASVVAELRAVLEDIKGARRLLAEKIDAAEAEFRDEIERGAAKIQAVRERLGFSTSAADGPLDEARASHFAADFLERFVAAFAAENLGGAGQGLLPFLHPSLERGGSVDAHFLENSLKTSQKRLHLLARPLEIESAKATARVSLGLFSEKDEGAEWLFRLKNSQPTGAIPPTARLFFSKKNGEARLSGLAF